MTITTSVQLPDFHPFMNADIPWFIRRSAAAHGERTPMTWELFDGEL